MDGTTTPVQTQPPTGDIGRPAAPEPSAAPLAPSGEPPSDGGQAGTESGAIGRVKEGPDVLEPGQEDAPRWPADQTVQAVPPADLPTTPPAEPLPQRPDGGGHAIPSEMGIPAP